MAKRRASSPTDDMLTGVDESRREALKRMLAGAVFIAPALVSLPLVYGSADPVDPQIHPFPTLRPRPTPRPRS